MGYRFQFVTLAGFHALNAAMFELARDYAQEGMSAYSGCRTTEFALEEDGLHGDAAPARGRRRLLRRGLAGDHRRQSSTLALEGSTEAAQFS